ncbi:MAG: MBL fold metallo-hydrolase [bacterium]|nr:MBL fold metallo-hydrolase [bacterium]
MAIKFKFCGGVGTVSGSMHLATTDKSAVLIDCGLFHGHRDEYYTVNSAFPINPSDLDCCIISHAHIDHCGNFPTLVNKGFRKKAYLTPSTMELCQYMLPDSGHIQEEDIKYVNKVNLRRGRPPREALYTRYDAENSLRYLYALDYHKKQRVTEDMELTFFDAGHILGSSIPTVDISANGKTIRIAYAVDLGRPNLPYVGNPEIPKKIDYLIIESTYGGRKHSPIEETEKKLMEVVNKTVARGGKIIVPSFALERTQEVIYFLSRLLRERKIKEIPIYVDSPLAVKVTKVFENNRDYFSKEIQDMDPLASENITYIEDVEQSKQLHNKRGPMVIISASGTCEHGRILHHLKNNIENPYNTIVIVGYMPQNTLGRRIVEHDRPTVNIFGRPYELKAEVVVVDSFSAHADSDYLVQYVNETRDSLKKVFIVHGEPEQSEKLKERLVSLNVESMIPEKNETVCLG